MSYYHLNLILQTMGLGLDLVMVKGSDLGSVMDWGLVMGHQCYKIRLHNRHSGLDLG